jgi:hypothetical protein
MTSGEDAADVDLGVDPLMATSWPAPSEAPVTSSAALAPEEDIPVADTSAQRARRNRIIIAGMTVVGCLPGLWLLDRTRSTKVVPNQGIKTTPIVTDYLRSRVRSMGSVRTPQFFAEVMKPGFWIVGFGLLLALPALLWILGRLVLRHRRPPAVLLVAVVLGGLAIAVAPFVVTSRDRAVGRAFVDRSGTIRRQLAGTCWFADWEGTAFVDLRAQYSTIVPDGSPVLACRYANFTSYERDLLGLPLVKDDPAPVLGIVEYSPDSIVVLGAVRVPGELQRISVDASGVIDVVYSEDSSGGTETCERQLSGSAMSDAC